MTDFSSIYNRLKKNYKKLNNLRKNNEITAYRLYEKDIPEYPFIIDVYNDFVVVYEKGVRLNESDTAQVELFNQHRQHAKQAICELFQIPEDHIIFKARTIQKGSGQYKKIEALGKFQIIQENGMKFKVNLYDYLDTGIFLDHRPLRKLLKETASGEVLNLFAYTGSLSVACALAGAKVTTVDMSHTYLDWAGENFRLNGLKIADYKFTQADALKYIDGLHKKYDCILLDPPSFSNSKRMEETFNVQDFHKDMIHKLMKWLNKDGVLYFSNNFTKFKMNPTIEKEFQVEEITHRTIPEDFRNKKIHRCFKISHK